MRLALLLLLISAPLFAQTASGPYLIEAEAWAAPRSGERLLAIEGVSMVSEGLSQSGQPCIKIGLIEENEALRASLPGELEGFPVEIEITGEFKPMYDR